MLKPALIFASVLSILIVLGIVGVAAYQQKSQFTKVKMELADLKLAAAQNASQAASLQQELTNSQARIEALIKEKEEVTKAQSEMEGQMRSALQSMDVTISELRGSLTVNILDRVLFPSAEAELKPEGEQVLAEVASVLSQHTNRQIYVIGHTDNVPIRSTIFSRYPSNWELSTARATAAVRYLSEKAGVDPTRLAAVGYGEYHPIADNSTPEGRAKNRRIAIVIVPEQFNPLEQQSDSPAPDLTITNAPPAGTISLPEQSSDDQTTNSPPPDPQ